MATNPFAQFVQPETQSNPFAQFVQPEEQANPFERFVKPEPTPEDQSVFRQVADVPLKVGAGFVQGVRMIADMFGAGSDTSKALRGAEDWIAALYSAQSRNDSREISRIMKEAEDKGVADQIKAGLRAFSVAPIDFVSQGLGTAAPTIFAALGAKILGAGALATTAITAGLGAGMGAGTVKGAIYDAVKEELAKTDMPKDEIEKRAELAQRYNGENLDQILMGAGIGGIAARTGLEASVAKAAAARIAGRAAAAEAAETAARQQVAKETAEAAARGPLLQGARTAGVESLTEGVQGSQEQVAKNIALQREGYDVPTFRGAVGAGTLEALASAPLGAAFGAREAIVARQEEARLADITNALNISAAELEAEQPLQGVTEEESQIQDRMIELMASRYESVFPKELAYAVALQMMEIRKNAEAEAKALGLTLPETAAARESTDTTVGVDPMRVRDLEDAFLNAGAEPGTARAAALAQATEEAYADWISERGATDVRQPVTPAGGEGVRVAGEPPAGPPTGGAGVAGTDGVVPPATDVGLPAARETPAPGTVETVTPTPDLTGAPSVTETPQAVEAKEERPAAAAETTATKPAAVAKPAKPEKPLGVLALADKLATDAFTNLDQYKGADQYEKLENAIRELRFALQTELENRGTKTGAYAPTLARFDKKVAELRKDAVSRNPILDPEGMGRSMAYAAFDQRGDFSGLEEAIDSYRDNLIDTLNENKSETFTNEVALRAFDDRVKELRKKEKPAPKKRGRPARSSVESVLDFKKLLLRGRGRPALPPEERAARAKARTGVRAQANRDARRLQQAASDLTTKNKERRMEALYNILDIVKTSQSTPRLNQARAMLKANTTEAERAELEKGYGAWKDNQVTDAALKAAENAQRKRKLTPEQIVEKNQLREQIKAVKFRGSSIYIIEELPDGEIGLVLPIVSIKSGPILTEVNRGRSFLEAKKAEEQLAFELATKNVEGKTEGSTFRMVDKGAYDIQKQRKRQEEKAATASARKAKQTERIKRQREDKINAQKDKIATLGKKLAAFRQNKPVDEAKLLLKEKEYKLEQLRLKVFEEKPIDWDADWEQGTKVRSLEDAAQEIRALQPKKAAKKGMTFEQQLAAARNIESKLKGRDAEEDVGAVVEQVAGARGRRATEDEAGTNDIALAGLFDTQVEEEVEEGVEAEQPAGEAKVKKPAGEKKKRKAAAKEKTVAPVEDKWAGVKRTTRGTVELVPTSSLAGVNQRNKTNTESDAYRALKASVAKQGIVDPITLTFDSVTKKVEVFEGNHRLQVARELGIEQVPVVLHKRINPSETVELEGIRPSEVLPAAKKPVEEPKQLTPQEQYASLVENLPGAPAFDALSKEAQKQIIDLAERNQLNLAAINRIASEGVKETAPQTLSQRTVRSGKSFLSSDYVYHAVRSDEDIASIVANGLNPDTNVSFYDSKLEGQAFAGEGDTILVFRKDDVEPEFKGYQADGLATKRAKPVAIFKDTVEANLPTQDEIADEANPLFEETQRLEEYLVREYNLNDADARQLKTFIATARAERPAGLPKEADDIVKRIRSLNAKVASLLDRFEKAPEKRVSEADILDRYSSYGVPVYGINLDFDERRDATTLAFNVAQAPKFSQTANVDKADARFSKFTTAAQATAHVARTGNAFQRALARRLSGLKILQNTKFVVLEPNDPTPKELKGDPGWAAARGVFIPSTNTIYVRSASDAMYGANNITVLHEALHAALQAKIDTGRQRLKAYRDALLRGQPVSGFATEVESLFVDLSRIARRAEAHFRSLNDMPAELLLTVASTQNERTGKYEIFSNLDEFLSYGMSDPVFQDFLKTVPMEGTTGFSRFVQAILRFLGMASNDQSALARLVDATDKLIAVPGKFERAKNVAFAKDVAQKILKTAAQAEAPARRYPKEVEEELKKLRKALGSASSIQRKAREQAANADKILNKVLRSHSSSTQAMQGLQQAVNNRGASGQNLNDALAAQYKGFKGGTLRQLLPALQTETLVDWSGRLGLDNVVLAWDQMKNLHAAQVKGLNDAVPISEGLFNLQRTKPGMYRTLAATMHYSTLRGVDPSTEAGRKASPSLARLWNSLSPEAKSLYETVRDFHAKNYNRHFELLEKLVDSYGLEGNIADASTPKGSLIASIRRMQEQGAGIKPYFPLMRFGNFWVRTGKGKDSTFHMFESQAAKEAFIEQHVRGTGKSKADLYADGLLKDGNDISSARKDMGDYNELLQRMFANIDSMETQEVIDDFGNPSPELARIRKEQLKDNIYQMILHTLPDASYRKQFIHRQGKEGFSEDIGRSFATLSTSMANQLARLEYSQQIQNALASARSALEGNPDAARLNEFIKEMGARAKLQLNPSPENSIGNQMANFANQTSFFYMMTNIKTAVAQMFSIPTFVGPVLASKHGVYRTAKALGSFAAIWNSVGMRKENADGSTSWVAPTIAQSRRVKLNPEERRAAQYMVDRGLSETTLAYDLGNRKQTPTEVQNSAPRRMLRASVNAMTALFHHTERLIREVSFMASFRLNRQKFPNASFEEIAQLAEKETLDAVGNYASINRPRGLGADAEGKVLLDAHKPIGRAILQFKMFPAFVTTYFVRNFYRMMGKGYTKEERKAAFVQFFGTLMMSFTLAGVMGIPGFSFALGVLSGLRKVMADDDEEDPLQKRNLELWFRNIWMPQTFGDTKIGGKPLSDIMDRGVLAALTGFDMTNSLSMNGLWLPSLKESPSVEAGVKEHLLAVMGPFASLVFSQIPRAIDNFNRGKLLEGMEQMMPAILRSPITAYRYATEGAQTTWGAEIKPANEFTIGQIIGQSLGFSTEGLVARREDLFRANQEAVKVKNEKRSLMDRLDQEVRTDDDVQAAIEKIVKFNQKNWFDPIKADQLSKSLLNRMERRARADRGADVEPSYYPQLMQLLEGSRRKLEAEAAK